MKTILSLFFIFLFTGLQAQEVLDRIVAVVDNEIILQSELNFRTEMTAARQKINPNDPKIKRKVLESMIEEKLLYAQSELDSIEVSDDQVSQQLDYQINYYIQQYGSREKVEEIYGMSIDRIKRELRSDTRKNLMAQMVQQKKFGTIEISRKEVEDFFERFQDSLGVVPQKYEIAHIFINPQKGDRIKQKAKEFAAKLLDSLKNGGDFAALARKFSDDPGSAKQGGDLGFVKRGVFYPEFESAAWILNKGELSGVVESPVGFHIIQLLERRGEAIHCRHILVKIKSDKEADIKAIDFLTELRDSIVTGKNTFEYFAKKYSDDKETAPYGGKLGTFDIGQLDKNMIDQVANLKEGEISFPKRLDVDKISYGYHIIKLIRKIPEHRPNIKTDYEDIKRLAEFDKKQKLYKNWMAELKKNIYWEIRL